MEMGQELSYSSLIMPKENDPNTWQADSHDEKGLTFREVTVDAQKRLSRIYYSFDASIPEANLASRVTTYNYDKLNTVEATTLEIEGEDTLTYKATFEYSITGNLMKVSTADNVISYEYGSIENKLYKFQKAYAGFDVFSPLSYNTSISIEAPMPSRKLPTKQIFETNNNTSVSYTWIINSNGYPTKVELLDESQETSTFEYGYVNCETR